MQHKTFLLSFFLMLPTLFMGQVLQEITPEPRGLPDPDQYPFEVYFKLGLPGGSFGVTTGYQNMQQALRDEGIELSRVRELNMLEAGFRYKRLYAEVGFAAESALFPTASFSNDRFAVSSNYLMGSVNLGYSVWQNRNTAILLRLGVGQLRTSYDIRPLDNLSPIDFDNLLAEGTGNPSTLIYHENIFWDISAELWRGRSKNRANFGEAMRIGYRSGINETAWQASNTNSLNAPLDRVGELYFNICFHLGSSFPPIAK